MIDSSANTNSRDAIVVVEGNSFCGALLAPQKCADHPTRLSHPVSMREAVKFRCYQNKRTKQARNGLF
jgi:hypothetical protein